MNERDEFPYQMIDNQNRRLSEEQQLFFNNSVVRDETGHLLTMYHGTSGSFDTFDTKFIRANDSDADYNGFWFSDDSHTLPAWTKLNERYEVYINLVNPAPKDVIDKVINDIKCECKDVKYVSDCFHSNSRSLCDEVRIRLQEKGYDGIIHDWKPKVNIEQLENEGQTVITTVRGYKYVLAKNKDYGGLDLFYYQKSAPKNRGELITGYLDVDDYLSLQERTVVVFSPEQIKAVDNRTPTLNPNFKHNDPSKEYPDGTIKKNRLNNQIDSAFFRASQQHSHSNMRGPER